MGEQYQIDINYINSILRWKDVVLRNLWTKLIKRKFLLQRMDILFLSSLSRKKLVL